MDSEQQGTFVEYDEDGDKVLNPGQLTQLEKQYHKEAVQKHRLNMTKQQKNFKGQAFIAKPSKIQFRDFTVGKPHYLVLTLTNVSNAFNSFNVLPLPLKIRNYFQVEYTPKGKMSPGISTQIRFKFLPQLNQDIHSEFTIQAQTGVISFEINCLSKKTIVKCAQPVVDLGRVIYGQSGKGKLKLMNQGTLASEMKIYCLQISGVEQSDSEFKTMLSQIKYESKTKIEGNADKVVEFQFVPTEIGVFQGWFEVYIQNFVHSPPIKFRVKGICVQVPVRIQKNLYDFEICLLNHIYREKLVFYNKGQIPMSFKIVQPNETKKYFQFNPIIGYIQKESKIQIWVKFTAQKDLGIYLNKYMVDDNNYEIPFQMQVKQQVLPVTFTINFKITSQKLIVRPMELNFGTIFQGLSSKIQISMENESDLPQEVLLQPSKKYIVLENDQTLFKILPKQKITTFIYYRTKKIQDQSKSLKDEGTIPCKIITGDISTNEIKIQYTSETLRPDLFIQHNKIDLPALQINEICQVSTVFRNISNKQIIYELFSPYFEVSGLKVTPSVKVLSPKQEVQVNIQYYSAYRKLSAQALNKIKNKYQLGQLVEEPPEIKKEEEPQQKKQSKKEAKKETKLTKQQQEALQIQQKRLQEEKRLQKQKEQKELAQMERNFDLKKTLQELGGQLYDFGETQHYKWLMPIYFKQKQYPDASTEVNFLEVTTTAVAQTLVSDQVQIDFGQIAVGTRAIRQLTITNKGEGAQLRKKQLPIFCCFSLLNSLKKIQKNGTFKAVIEFQPIQQQKFQQRIQFYTQRSTISCLLKGKGVRPQIQIDPKDCLVNLGGVVLEEYVEKTFKVKNVCNFPIEFIIQRIGEGILNKSSLRAISYIPVTGIIDPNNQISVKVVFKPDRISENFFEKIKVHVAEQKQEKFLAVKGMCFKRQAYVRDFTENIMPSDVKVRERLQSPFDWLSVKDEDKIYGPENKKILLQYKKLQKSTEEIDQLCLKRKVIIGSCKMLDPKNQKPTNFEIIMPKDQKMFQCDNIKGTVAPGSETVITFLFKPQQPDSFIAQIPVLVGVGQWKQIKAQLKVSGGFIKAGTTDSISFEVILRAYVTQL